jgi:hypothetical protein
MKANKAFPWSYKYFSENPNITFDIINEKPDIEWDYNLLSRNKMDKHPFKKTLGNFLKGGKRRRTRTKRTRTKRTRTKRTRTKRTHTKRTRT